MVTMASTWYWLSTPVFTCVVEVLENGSIGPNSAVIVQKFWGQPVMRLCIWCEGKWPGQVRWEVLP